MLIFRLFFILADKISRFAKSWLPIQNLNSVARSEIPYLNWRYNFVTFSHNFCQNAWTSSLCTHPNNQMVFFGTQNFLVHLTISEVAFFLCTHDEIWSYQKSNSFNAFSTQYCPLQNLSSFFQKRNNIWRKTFQNLACFIFHLFQRIFENNNGYIRFCNYNKA